MSESLDEAGKWFASVAMIASGAFLIILSIAINFLDMLVFVAVGIALCCFGGFVFYLRRMSITSQEQVKKPKVTRVIREIPKPKPKPESTVQEEKPKEAEILCDTCEFYDEYNTKQKCRYLTDADRMAMINAGMQCVEYKIKLSLLD